MNFKVGDKVIFKSLEKIKMLYPNINYNIIDDIIKHQKIPMKVVSIKSYKNVDTVELFPYPYKSLKPHRETGSLDERIFKKYSNVAKLSDNLFEL